MVEMAGQRAETCTRSLRVNEEADFALNQKIGAPAALSPSEHASAKALAELAKDHQHGFAETKALPPGNEVLSIWHRQSVDLDKMTDLLKGKTNDEIDRMLAGADQLLGGTSLKLARAGTHVWIGDKDFANENVDPAHRRYTPATMFMGWTPADTCPQQYHPVTPSYPKPPSYLKPSSFPTAPYRPLPPPPFRP